MRIGLIADTHVPTVAPEVPHQVGEVFRGVDLILHAGDVQVARVLDWLEGIAPVYAATGNNDYLFEDPRMRPVQLLEAEGVRVGAIHVFAYPDLPLEHYFKHHFGGPLDVVIYGDTHVPEVLRRDGVLMVNPGSPTCPGPHMSPGLGHVGLLEVRRGVAEARIVPLGPPPQGASTYLRQ